MALVKSLNEMLAAAQIVEYLDIEGLPLMRLLAALPMHELSSGCFFPSLSLTHTHTQIHYESIKSLRFPQPLRGRGLFIPGAL